MSIAATTIESTPEKLNAQSARPAACAEPAKDLLRNILERDPRKRITAADVLQHAWLREDGIAASEPIELEVLKRMKKFSAGNRLRKEAIKLMATNLPIDEIMGLKSVRGLWGIKG